MESSNLWIQSLHFWYIFFRNVQHSGVSIIANFFVLQSLHAYEQLKSFFAALFRRGFLCLPWQLGCCRLFVDTYKFLIQKEKLQFHRNYTFVIFLFLCSFPLHRRLLWWAVSILYCQFVLFHLFKKKIKLYQYSQMTLAWVKKKMMAIRH